MMGKFPWADAVAALNDTAKTSHYTQLLLDQLSTSLLQEPIVAPRPSCHPPPLMQAADIQCSKYPHAFTPKERREKPVKVAHLIQMGFDADMLEVLLHELDDVVDKFFVIESTRTHNKDTRKILMWDRLKYQPRFDFVKDKVVHLVLDDSETLVNPEVPFARESLQEKARWDSFLSWNKHSKYFGPEDLVGFGDTDEIPARSNVQLLRHCTMAGASVDIGSWFAPTRLDEAFRPDWPVPGHPWTLGDPTYWTVASATEYGNAGNQYPSRMRGMSGKFLLGGIHMTDNGYFPMRMAKLVACTECSDRAVRLIQDMASYFQDGNAGKEVLSQLDLYLNPVWPDRKRFVEGDMIKPT
ncbi:beta- -mannosyl-glycoprotein beta- -n-acetylglucosaminyltransferase, partial [Nannochloropsis gaditana CCMP526]